MTVLELGILFGAGLFGGVLNAIAGGGSFITFPALMWVGVAPISANATNTLASCAGYLSGAWAFRRDLANSPGPLLQMLVLSLVGGAIGAWLLLAIPDATFRQAIPWLLLLATLLFVFARHLNSSLRKLVSVHRHSPAAAAILLALVLLAVGIYGGFFNAGLGIMLLSLLALAGYSDINTMNGLKLLLSSCISITAIAVFIYQGAIAWQQGTAVLLGTLAGSYLAARLSRRLPEQWIRGVVIVTSCAVTSYYFATS